MFIDVKTINGTKYYHKFNKHYNTTLENEVPIYNQILQEEAIQLNKSTQLIKSNGGEVIDLNTDAVICTFPNNEFPFKLVDDIQLDDHYWDTENKIPKYKIEHDKERLKSSKLQQSLRTDEYKFDIYYNWKVKPDADDNNFKPLEDKIIESNKLYFITGPGGSGKTELIKQLQAVIKDKGEIFLICSTYKFKRFVNWWDYYS